MVEETTRNIGKKRNIRRKERKARNTNTKRKRRRRKRREADTTTSNHVIVIKTNLAKVTIENKSSFVVMVTIAVAAVAVLTLVIATVVAAVLPEIALMRVDGVKVLLTSGRVLLSPPEVTTAILGVINYTIWGGQ